MFLAILSACNPIYVNNPSGLLTEEYPYLTFTIEFDKNTYHTGDTITAKMILRNIGDEGVVVKKRLIVNQFASPEPYRDVSFFVIAPSRTSIPFGAYISVDSPGIDDFTTLMPGNSIEGYYELQDVFTIDETGKYLVIAVYINQLNPDDGRMAWKGEVTSNIATFSFDP
jgi:hypothetical protein